MTGIEWLGVAFTATNSLRALMYLPQARAVAMSEHAASDISLPTWWMFAANNLLGAAYCAAVLGNYAIAASFLAAGVGSLSIIGLTLAKRRRATPEAPSWTSSRSA